MVLKAPSPRPSALARAYHGDRGGDAIAGQQAGTLMRKSPPAALALHSRSRQHTCRSALQPLRQCKCQQQRSYRLHIQLGLLNIENFGEGRLHILQRHETMTDHMRALLRKRPTAAGSKVTHLSSAVTTLLGPLCQRRQPAVAQVDGLKEALPTASQSVTGLIRRHASRRCESVVFLGNCSI